MLAKKMKKKVLVKREVPIKKCSSHCESVPIIKGFPCHRQCLWWKWQLICFAFAASSGAHLYVSLSSMQKTFTFFPCVHFSSLLTELRFYLWKWVCVQHHLENCRMWAAAQPSPAISGCSQGHSHLRQNWLLLVQLCNQPCILWLGSFLTPRAVFTLQENALCKAFVPCSLSSAEARFSGQHPTYGVSPSKVLSSLRERQAFFQFPGFLRTLTLLHKTRLSLRVFHLFTGMWFIFSQLLSFLLISPFWPQNSKAAYSHSSQSYRQCIHVIAEEQNSVLGDGLLGGQGKK